MRHDPLDPFEQLLHESNYPLRRRVVNGFKGKFTSWRRGEIVLAKKTGRDFSIRKLKMRGTRVPIAQCCCAVPYRNLEVVRS